MRLTNCFVWKTVCSCFLVVCLVFSQVIIVPKVAFAEPTDEPTNYALSSDEQVGKAANRGLALNATTIITGLLTMASRAALAGICGGVADKTDSSIMSALEFMIGSKAHNFGRISKKIDSLSDQITEVQVQIEELSAMSEEYFVEIIDILKNQDIQAQEAQINNYVGSYRVAWDHYVDLVEYQNNNPGPYTEKQTTEIRRMMDKVVTSAVGTGGVDEMKKLRDDINGLANTVSDSTRGITLNGVSSDADVTGGHTDRQTYVKAVKAKVLEQGGPLFEHQLHTVMLSRTSEVAMGQVQLLVLYNEIANYWALSDNPRKQKMGEDLLADYEIMYNYTMNSINNMVEQADLAKLMPASEVEKVLYLDNVKAADAGKTMPVSCVTRLVVEEVADSQIGSVYSYTGDTFLIPTNKTDMALFETTRIDDVNYPTEKYDVYYGYHADKYWDNYPYEAAFRFPYASLALPTFATEKPQVVANLGLLDNSVSARTGTNITLFDATDRHDLYKKYQEDFSDGAAAFLNEVGDLSINSPLDVQAILLATADSHFAYGDTSKIEIEELLLRPPGYYERTSHFIKGSWLQNDIDATNNGASFLEYNMGKDGAINNETHLYEAIDQALPIYNYKSTALQTFKVSQKGSSSGSVNLTAPTPPGSSYWTVSPGSEISIDATPLPYTVVSGVDFLPLDNTSKPMRMAGYLSKSSDPSKPLMNSVAFTAPYASGTFEVTFDWVELHRYFDGVGTPEHPYLIESSADIDRYVDLKNAGYPLDQCSFVLGGGMGSGTEVDPYVISSVEQQSFVSDFLDLGIMLPTQFYRPAFLSGEGTTEAPFVLGAMKDVEDVTSFTSLGISFESFRFATTLFSGSGTSLSPYLINTEKDVEVFNAIKVAIPNFGTYQKIGTSLLPGAGTKQDPYRISSDKQFEDAKFLNDSVDLFSSCVAVFDLASYLKCSGSGSAENPLEVSEIAQLDFIKQAIDGHGKITAIDPSVTFFKLTYSGAVEGVGSPQNPYLVGNVADFEALNLPSKNRLTDSKIVELQADLDFGGAAPKPLEHTNFILRGNNHAFENYAATGDGLFLKNAGAILDVSIRNVITNEHTGGALFVKENTGELTSITFEHTGRMYTQDVALVGENSGTVTGGTFRIQGSASHMAGVAVVNHGTVRLASIVFEGGETLSHVHGVAMSSSHILGVQVSMNATTIEDSFGLTGDARVEIVAKKVEIKATDIVRVSGVAGQSEAVIGYSAITIEAENSLTDVYGVMEKGKQVAKNVVSDVNVSLSAPSMLRVYGVAREDSGLVMTCSTDISFNTGDTVCGLVGANDGGIILQNKAQIEGASGSNIFGATETNTHWVLLNEIEVNIGEAASLAGIAKVNTGLTAGNKVDGAVRAGSYAAGHVLQNEGVIVDAACAVDFGTKENPFALTRTGGIAYVNNFETSLIANSSYTGTLYASPVLAGDDEAEIDAISAGGTLADPVAPITKEGALRVVFSTHGDLVGGEASSGDQSSSAASLSAANASLASVQSSETNGVFFDEAGRAYLLPLSDIKSKEFAYRMNMQLGSLDRSAVGGVASEYEDAAFKYWTQADEVNDGLPFFATDAYPPVLSLEQSENSSTKGEVSTQGGLLSKTGDDVPLGALLGLVLLGLGVCGIAYRGRKREH